MQAFQNITKLKKRASRYSVSLRVISHSQKQSPVVFIKKVFLKISQNSQENSCIRVLLVSVCNFIKKDTQTQVFSCKFYEISKNSFCYRKSDGSFCITFQLSLFKILENFQEKFVYSKASDV